MPVASMTGFARWEGGVGDNTLVWELRSVNGKGLDVRLRLPQGLEPIEGELKRATAAQFSRGNIQAGLQVRRDADATRLTINRDVLEQMLRLSQEIVAEGYAALPTADGLLSLRGVIEVVEDPAERSAEMHEIGRQAVDGFVQALDALNAARLEEGAAIGAVLAKRIDEIEALTARAETDGARAPAAIRERLRGQIVQLLDAGTPVEEQRIAQEAALLATRADIREELDRLAAHVDAARKLLQGGPVGRRLDFLAQEFNREANTLCSKSNAASLTAIGLELKVVVEQFREQVQNIE